MDRNSIIGLSLIGLILVGTFFINKPTVEELERRQKVQDSLALVARQQSEDSVRLQQKKLDERPDSVRLIQDSIANKNRMGSFTPIATGKDEHVILENDLMRLELASKGGQPYSLLLKPYKRAKQEGQEEQEELYLFSGTEQTFGYTFATQESKQISTKELFFTPSAKSVKIEKDSASITMRAALSNDVYLEQTYTLYPESFEVGYSIKTVGFDKVLSRSNNYLLLDWAIEMPVQERSQEAELDKSTIYYSFLNNEVDEVSPRDFEKVELDEGSLRWVSFKQQFFNSTLISEDATGFEDAIVNVEQAQDKGHVKKLSTQFYLTHDLGKEKQYNMRFFFGPNHYQILKESGNDLEELVPLGWGIFGWVNRGIVIPVFNFLDDYVSSYGIIILLLTLIIKAGLFPLVYKSYMSTAKMRALKPEMDEIKEKNAKDPQKLQQENMKLFKKAGVSPLGGCLPMVLQMPILFALFNFFPVSFELRQQGFLWAHDLSTYDSIWDFGKLPVIDFIYGDHVSLFTLLMTISTLLYTRFNNQISGMSGQMKYIGYIMPVVFLGFFNKYAAGLSYYYFLSTCITFLQQFVIRQFVDDDKIHAKIQENKKRPVKTSKFQQRMNQMMKEQQQKQQQQRKKKR